MVPAPLALSIPLAAVLAVLAVPSAMTGFRGRNGRLARRGRLGLHTPAAQLSDEAFALANRVAAPLMISAGMVGLGCAVLVLAVPAGVAGAVVIAILGLAGVLGQLTAASHLGERAARTVPVPARKPAGGGCCGGCGCGGGECQNASESAAIADGAHSNGAASEIPDLLPDATVAR